MLKTESFGKSIWSDPILLREWANQVKSGTAQRVIPQPCNIQNIEQLVETTFASNETSHVDGTRQLLGLMWAEEGNLSESFWDLYRTHTQGLWFNVASEGKDGTPHTVRIPVDVAITFLDTCSDGFMMSLYSSMMFPPQKYDGPPLKKSLVDEYPRKYWPEAIRSKSRKLLRWIASSKKNLENDPGLAYKASILLHDASMNEQALSLPEPEIIQGAINAMVDWSLARAYWYVNIIGNYKTMQQFVDAVIERHPALEGQEQRILRRISRYHRRTNLKEKKKLLFGTPEGVYRPQEPFKRSSN